MSAQNKQQTPGPVFADAADYCAEHPALRSFSPVNGSLVFVAKVESAKDARLLASAYTAFDKAGRELGIDAATLAERVDLAALITAARGAVHSLNLAFNSEGDTFGIHHNDTTDTLDALETILANVERAKP